MMDFEAYFEEEEIEQQLEELKAYEESMCKNNIKLLLRYSRKRDKAALKNENFFDKEEKKKCILYGRYVAVKPQTKSFLKKKMKRSNRAEINGRFKKMYFSGMFDEDMAG